MGRARRLLAALAALLLLCACGVQTALMDTTPEADGVVSVAGSASQAFYAPVDGLDRLSVGLAPEVAQSQTFPRLAAGATYQISYAPELDPAYPDGSFHDWPASEQWDGELIGARTIGQSFVSLYPGLDGITVRVATFGADSGNGTATLKPGGPVAVLALPVDGALLATVPGGSQLPVAGSAEGWARVTLPDGQGGYVALDRFARLPPPERVNDQDVTLRLYRDGEPEPVRQVAINARQIHDNSHLTFSFAALDDPVGGRYRFTLTSPGSHPGDAVTFRFAPADVYAGGTRFEDGAAAGGDLIFRPHYGPQPVLASGKLDDFVWSAQTNTLDGAFAPIRGTAGRFLRLTIRAGDRPLDLAWSSSRPQGGQTLQVEGGTQPQQGALVLNAGFRQPVPLRSLASGASGTLARDARHDPIFFALYALLAAAVVACWLVLLVPVVRRGR